MKRSLSRKYFLVYLACVLASIIVLGIVFLAFSTSYFERDKYNIMKRNATMAAGITANNYYSDEAVNYVDEPTITATYNALSKAINADFFLVDLKGNLVYHSDPSQLKQGEALVIPPEIVLRAAKDQYSATGVFPGIAHSPTYIVGVPVIVEGSPVAVIFAASSAVDLVRFLQQVVKMFLLSAGIVLLLASVLISYFTSRMVKPLKQMLDATNSFSNGDFSKRVPVSSYDEMGQLAMAFNNMAATLAVNESSRRSFIANVSHELKTPMTTIGGFVDGILDGTIPPEKQDQYLVIVSSEVQRLSRLVHSMLDTARIEAGEMEIDKKVFDISEIVRQTIFTFEQRITEKKLHITGLEKDRVMVLADQDLMHQVVYNLVENAVKFVEIEGEISVRYEIKDGKVYTTIRNTGEGLSKEESSRIFDRFYKSDRARTGLSGGVGLGLHIVRTIIQHHNGELKAESVEGQYTEFTFGVLQPPNGKKKEQKKELKKEPKKE